ncbi:N-acetyltransferase [Pseudolysobacter antarcticus]|uniref:N-acetyltransferase n=1 Tax=Pseudolysobacter antarcticus TaxID=2511995 RepID=A0A411HFA5_9GAMM|nr:GNAT family N-acetyltransferase [Pseudolysobacter antarcticus]QBB69157.1 N-acetyltransferase [Pseudolysobacter antarcticus]
MKTAQLIQTDRLILRQPQSSDLEPWAAMMAEPDTMEFLGGTQPRSSAWRAMATMAGSWALQGFGMFSVIERSSGRWLGRIGPWMPAEWPGTEVGWALSRDARGRGYAEEAAIASIDWAFDALGWDEVIHCIDPRNQGSIALALRLGSRRQRESRLPAPLEQMVVDIYGQSRADWRQRAGR